MIPLTLAAPAKLNLTLDILGRREDGYHDMKMVMQSVSLADRVTLEPGEAGEPGGSGRITAVSGLRFLPQDRGNLAVSAALAFFEALGQEPPDLRLTLEKNIPVCAGTAGGSSDAAAVLRGLNRMTGAGFSPSQLAEIGASVGSDVPYCVMGGTMLAEGRGEVLTPLPSLPDCFIVLCKPAFPISTPELFRAWDKRKKRLRPDTEGLTDALSRGDLHGVAQRVYNVFEAVLPDNQRKEIDRIKSAMIQYGALGSAMTGSGPTVFGIFDREDAAQAAAEELARLYTEVFLTRPVGRHEA